MWDQIAHNSTPIPLSLHNGPSPKKFYLKNILNHFKIILK
jgi:hypothetical protein